MSSGDRLQISRMSPRATADVPRRLTNHGPSITRPAYTPPAAMTRPLERSPGGVSVLLTVSSSPPNCRAWASIVAAGVRLAQHGSSG